MKRAMVSAAERNGEFIADFEPQCARLRKTYMMRVTGVASADQAGLGGDKAQMQFIAARLGSGNARTLLSIFSVVGRITGAMGGADDASSVNCSFSDGPCRLP